jgi:hypothetical protein
MTAADTPPLLLPPSPACPPPPVSCAAGEGSSTEAAEQAIVTIGDKGRAQLQRVAPDQIRLSVAETYKDRVTFSQVGKQSESTVGVVLTLGVGWVWHCSERHTRTGSPSARCVCVWGVRGVTLFLCGFVRDNSVCVDIQGQGHLQPGVWGCL